MSLSPTARSMRARVGAYALHATHDSREITAPARRAFLARFEREVDPDGKLDPAERGRRAEMAKRLHFARMAFKRHRKGGRQ
jgi:hypothetical protein